MSGFRLDNNGKGINLDLFRNKLHLSDVKDNNLKQLVKFFDKDGNNILDASEIKKLLNEMGEYASSNNNSIFEKEEIEQFLEKSVDSQGESLSSKKITSNNVMTFLKILSLSNNCETAGVNTQSARLSEEESQKVAVDTLNYESAKARQLFDKQNIEQGRVKDSVNWVKELFNTENAATNTDRALMLDSFSSYLISKSSSSEGMTYREYYEAKIEFLLQLIKKFANSIDETTLEQSRRGLKNLEPERIDSILQSIGTISDNCAPEDIPEVIKNMVQEQFNAQSIISNNLPDSKSELANASISKGANTLENMEASGELDKKIAFEDVFFRERGVVYNEEAISDYTVKSSQMQILTSMNNTIAMINSVTESVAGASGSEIYCSKGDLEIVENLLSNIYGSDVEKIQKELDSLTIKSTIGDDGKLHLSTDMGVPTRAIVLKMLTKLKDTHQTRFEQALGGKSFKEYADDTSAAYKKAYGNTNINNIVQNYINSQEAGVGWMKAGAQFGGMAIMLAGNLIPSPAGKVVSLLANGGKAVLSSSGLLTAAFGGAGVSYLENNTKAGGLTNEDKKEILDELKTSGLLTLTGMGIGKVAEGAKTAVLALRNCPKFLAYASEVGVDTALSLVADAAITGEVDFTGEGIAQLTNVIVGIVQAKAHSKTSGNQSNIVGTKLDESVKIEFDENGYPKLDVI
ncbi:MAG: hypothetical protein NC334_09555, partial [Bacteroides sp.]|nr:hypothetical protein [Bacteroides sp.]